MARAWAKNARSLAALFQKVDDLLKAEKRHAGQKCGSPASQRVGKHEMPRDGVRPRRIALTAGGQAEQEPHDPNDDRELAEKVVVHKAAHAAAPALLIRVKQLVRIGRERVADVHQHVKVRVGIAPFTYLKILVFQSIFPTNL